MEKRLAEEAAVRESVRKIDVSLGRALYLLRTIVNVNPVEFQVPLLFLSLSSSLLFIILQLFALSLLQSFIPDLVQILYPTLSSPLVGCFASYRRHKHTSAWNDPFLCFLLFQASSRVTEVISLISCSFHSQRFARLAFQIFHAYLNVCPPFDPVDIMWYAEGDEGKFAFVNHELVSL